MNRCGVSKYVRRYLGCGSCVPRCFPERGIVADALVNTEPGHRRLRSSNEYRRFGRQVRSALIQHRLQRLGRLVPERSEEHTSELQSLMRISYAVFCLK